MEEKKSYYAVIPANIRYDEDITPNAKLLYAEITALCNEKGYCWAGNGYFAQLYKVSKGTISRWISQLEKNNYIITKLNYKEGTKQILNRYIQICYDPINKNDNTPINNIVKDNNTSINNTFNKEKIYKKESFVKPTLEELQEYITEKKINVDAEHFIDYYEGNGWLVGKNKMKDWKAVVRNWERRSKDFKKTTYGKKEDVVPEWFGKEIEVKVASPASRKKIEDILKEYKN